MKGLLYSLILGIMVLFCGALQAQQKTVEIKKGVVAKSEVELSVMNSMSDKELSAQIESLDGPQITEQVVAMNDGKHSTLLARVLISVKRLMGGWSESKQNAVAQGLNTLTQNIEVKNQNTVALQINIKTPNGNVAIEDKSQVTQIANALQTSPIPTAAKAETVKEEGTQKAVATADADVATSALTNPGAGNSAATDGEQNSFLTNSISPYAGSPYAEKNSEPTSSSPFAM